MNIGIDIDHTITEAPEFFATLMKGFKASGHKIHIVSYRDAEDEEKTIAELGDEYGIRLGHEYDSLHLNGGDETIPDYKSRVARELDLDIFFDDMPEALLKLPQKCIRFWMCDPSVYDMDKVVDNLVGVLKFG